MMADLGMVHRGIRSPVAAGLVVGARHGTAMAVRARHDVVLVHGPFRTSDAARYLHAFLVERGFLDDVVAVALDVPMQIGDVGRDLHALGIVPGAGADTVARIHRASSLRAEIGAPGAVRRRSRRLSEALAARIGARQAAEIAGA